MKFYEHSLIIFSSFILVFLWQNSQFSSYTIPFVGLLIFVFLLVSIKNKGNFNFGGPVNFFILNTVLLLFIFSTGGINSNLFFILYFLLFGAAFIMDPRSVFIVPVGVIILFWNQIFTGDITSNLIRIGSIILISPLAYFFGKQFRFSEKEEDEVLKTKERAHSSGKEIAKDVEEVLDTAKNKLSSGEVDELKQVLEESQSLKQETQG